MRTHEPGDGGHDEPDEDWVTSTLPVALPFVSLQLDVAELDVLCAALTKIRSAAEDVGVLPIVDSLYAQFSEAAEMLRRLADDAQKKVLHEVSLLEQLLRQR